jgi:hypothetical protein
MMGKSKISRNDPALAQDAETYGDGRYTASKFTATVNTLTEADFANLSIPPERSATLDIPGDSVLLVAVGSVNLRHSQLDHMLKMTMKVLTGVTIEDAMDANAFKTSGILRARVLKLAKARFGEGKVFIQLEALLERCRRATERRNELVHSTWARRSLDGVHAVHGPEGWETPPAVQSLCDLADEIHQLSMELNYARLHGFLAEALGKKR